VTSGKRRARTRGAETTTASTNCSSDPERLRRSRIERRWPRRDGQCLARRQRGARRRSAVRHEICRDPPLSCCGSLRCAVVDLSRRARSVLDDRRPCLVRRSPQRRRVQRCAHRSSRRTRGPSRQQRSSARAWCRRSRRQAGIRKSRERCKERRRCKAGCLAKSSDAAARRGSARNLPFLLTGGTRPSTSLRPAASTARATSNASAPSSPTKPAPALKAHLP
jgi:hypothetical protein